MGFRQIFDNVKKADGVMSAIVAALVLGLFHARTFAHLLHLQTRSYAQHMALDALYNDIGGLVDAYVEAFQGRYGVIVEYPNSLPPFPVSDPIQFIRLS